MPGKRELDVREVRNLIIVGSTGRDTAACGGRDHITRESDHTDRKAKTMGVSLSKQMCAKPVSLQVRRYDDIAPHWDQLVIRSFVRSNSERRLYQVGPLRALRPSAKLIRLLAGDDRLPEGSAMFFGMLAVHGTIEPTEEFEMELDDPVLRRRIAHSYSIATLPDGLKEVAMGYDKGHKEFHKLNLQDGWHSLPGYPDGIQEKIVAGALDETGKRGNRTRLLKFAPGTYTTAPFVHDYWEEVFLVSGDLIVGNDAQGRGGERFEGYTYAVRPPGVYHGPFKSETGCLLLETHYFDDDK